MNILQVQSNTRASPLTDPYPDNIRTRCKKARKSGERETSLVACQTDRFEGHHHRPRNLPHPIPRLEHYMSVDRPRNVKVDLDIVRRGYVDTFLLQKSTQSIPPFAYTQRNLVLTRYCLPRNAKSFVAAFGPGPGLEPAVSLGRRSIKIHHAALLQRSGTPLYTRLTNLLSFREVTIQLLMSPPGWRGTSIRPHLCTRRSSRLRSSSVRSCEGRLVTEVGEGGAPEGGEAGV